MNRIILYLFSLFTSFVVAQESYTYAVVPEKFENLDKNEHQLNDMTASFFKTEGFITYFDTDKLPVELANNRCEAIFIDAKVNSSLFTTKVIIEIKDCQNTILATSIEASSRKKEYKLAYNEAFRMALLSLRGKVKVGKTENPKISENKIIQPEITTKSDKAKPVLAENSNNLMLKTAKIANGYALKTAEGEKVMDIYTTTSDIVFIGIRGNLQGVLIKKANSWFFEYYLNNKLVSEPVNFRI